MNRPQPFVLTSTSHGPMLVNRMDYHAVPGGAYGVGAQLLGAGTYDPNEIAIMLAHIERLHTARGRELLAVDCGANIGVHTLELARAMGNRGQVLAFEPQERLFYALCGNIALNNVFNATARFAAIGDGNGFIHVPKPDYGRPGSFGSLELRRTASTEYIGQSISYAAKDLAPVPLWRLDDLNLPRLDFLKIDVEGMELDVLHGATKLVSEFHPVIVAEWIKSGKDSLLEFFAVMDYECNVVDGNIWAVQKGE